jgi:transcriptional regulator with XRE-family HTH domain
MSAQVRARRRQGGLLLRDLAAVADITVSHLSLIERGERMPSPPVAKRIADHFGTDIDELWPGYSDDQAETTGAAA